MATFETNEKTWNDLHYTPVPSEAGDVVRNTNGITAIGGPESNKLFTSSGSCAGVLGALELYESGLSSTTQKDTSKDQSAIESSLPQSAYESFGKAVQEGGVPKSPKELEQHWPKDEIPPLSNEYPKGSDGMPQRMHEKPEKGALTNR